ncbi:MAG: C1 family peptidase [Bacteroidota bacterium]
MKKLLVFTLALVCYGAARAQSINLSQVFTHDTIIEFSNPTLKYGFVLNGTVQLNSDTAFVRVLIEDTLSNQYLVCDVNLLTTDANKARTLSNYSVESYSLPGVVIGKMRLQLNDAVLTFSDYNLRSVYQTNQALEQANNFKIKNLENRDMIRDYIARNHYSWIADTTEMSKLTYEEKRMIFVKENGELPNLYGFDYYFDGYFSFPNAPAEVTGNITGSFDWRNRHGANNPASPYWDGDNTDWSGWNTTRTQTQIAPNCWAFAPTYSLEALINLYYNNHINYNLSEQDVVSCSGGQAPPTPASPTCPGGSPSDAVDYIKTAGVVDELCFPYTGECYYAMPSCSVKCTTPAFNIKAASYNTQWSLTTDFVKEKIITEGPVGGVVSPWGHIMSLEGFGIVREGDRIMSGNLGYNSSPEIWVTPESQDIGKTYWIFKQTWGSYTPEDIPYIKVVMDISKLHLYWNEVPLTCTGSNPLTESDRRCVDLDGDGYFWWGIGDKPAGCICPNEEDCDDSDPFLGPYDPITYECQPLCGNFVFSPIPLEITTDELWESPKYVNRDIIVKSGKSLTVRKTNLNMHPNAEIEVEPGAKLIIDEGTVKNFCGVNWKGIEVIGNRTQPQTPLYQGVVEIKNFGRIENAICGITTCKKVNGVIDWTTTGGIIRIDKGSFENCVKSIEFLSYKPIPYIGQPSPSSPGSWLKMASFRINSATPLSTYTPISFVSLYDVSNILFEGCGFRNEMGDNLLIIGINSIDSKYTIKSYLFENNAYKNYFINLERGINISNTNLYRTPFIDNCEFHGVLNGITVFGTVGLNVQRCTFVQGDSWSIVNDRVGLYMKKCTGYFVSENGFSELKNSLVVNQSGTKSNEVYKNYVRSGIVGIQAQGVNSNYATGIGLQFKCNEFWGSNAVNFGITGNIAPTQGFCSDVTTPAGNRFNHYNLDFVVNSGVSAFNYRHHSGFDYTPAPPLPSQVIAVPCVGITFNPATSCPSKISTGGNDPSTLKTAIAQYQNELAPKQALIDAGNTTALLNTASNGSAVQAKNAILAVSPYTSDAVLIAAVNRGNPLPPGNLKQVIVANSPVTEPVMNAINSKSIPVGIKREIVAAQTGTSARVTLEKEIAGLQIEIELLQNDLVRAYMNDTLGSGTDSLIVYLQTQNDPSFKTLLCDAYLSKNDCNAALAIVNQMPSGTQDEQYMKQLYELKANLCSQGKTYFDMTPTEKSLVETIAQSNTDASIQAKAILVLLDNIYIPVEIDALEIPDSLMLKGTLLSSANCGNNPVENYILILTDENNNPITSISPVLTDENGEFKFDYFETLGLDTTMLFGIATQGGFKIGSLGYKTIKQWIDGSPWTMTLEDVSEVWVATMSHNDNIVEAATALDLQGNVYVTGSGHSQAYGFDCVTIMYGADGKEIWLADYNNGDTLSYDDFSTALDVDQQGNVYVTGYSMDVEGYYDYLTLKYNTEGVLLWETRYTGGFEDKAISIAVDNTSKSGAVVTGSTQNGQGINSIKTIKYNPDGSVYWQHQYNDPNSEGIVPVKTIVDDLGSIYVAANTLGANQNYALLKYDPNGTLLWTMFYNNGSVDEISNMCLDAAGHIVVSGTSYNTNVPEIATIAYNSNGTQAWVKRDALPANAPLQCYDVTANDKNLIFVAGGSSNGARTICYNVYGEPQWITDEVFTQGETILKLKVAPAKDSKASIVLHALVPVGGTQIVKTTRLIMYKADGTELWRKVNDQWTGISSLGVSVNDNVYLAGTTSFYEDGIHINSLTTAKYSQCPSASSLLKQNSTSINSGQNNTDLQFDLFPNPAKDEVNLRINKPLAADADICIYNFQGSLQKCLHILKGTNQYTVSTKEFANGIYLVQINVNGNLPENRKLVILK